MSVERRREPRFNISKTVRLRVLDRMAGPRLGRRIDAEVVEVSGSGIRLRTPAPVPCGAPIEIHDRKLLLVAKPAAACSNKEPIP